MFKEPNKSSEMLLVQSMDFNIINVSRRKCLFCSCCVKRGKEKHRNSKTGCSDGLPPHSSLQLADWIISMMWLSLIAIY